MLLALCLSGCTTTHAAWPDDRDVVGGVYELTVADGQDDWHKMPRDDWKKTARAEQAGNRVAWRDTTTGALIDSSRIRVLERTNHWLGAFVGAPLGLLIGAGVAAAIGALAEVGRTGFFRGPAMGAAGGAVLGGLLGLLFGTIIGAATGVTDRYEVAGLPHPVAPGPEVPPPTNPRLVP